MTKQQVITELRKLHRKLGPKFNRENIRKESSKLDYWIEQLFSTYSEAYKTAGISREVDNHIIHETQHSDSQDIPPRPMVKDSAWLGRAAEYLVLAELLYQGYNATRMTMDTGVDVFALRDDKTFYLQVKSTSYNTVKKEIKISVDSFTKNNGGNYYYILVITDNDAGIRDILVLPSIQIQVILNKDIEKIGGRAIVLKIRKEGKNIFLNNIDVTFWKNRWQIIK